MLYKKALKKALCQKPSLYKKTYAVKNFFTDFGASGFAAYFNKTGQKNLPIWNMGRFFEFQLNLKKCIDKTARFLMQSQLKRGVFLFFNSFYSASSTFASEAFLRTLSMPFLQEAFALYPSEERIISPLRALRRKRNSPALSS